MGYRTRPILVLSIVLIISVACISFNSAYAVNQKTLHYNIIVPMLSESCIRLNQQGPNNSCPTLENLAPFDTSNQNISGKFIIYNGELIRTSPQVKNHFMYYQYAAKPVICVECYYPGKFADIVQLVLIEPNGFTWIDSNSKSSPVINRQILLHHDRYVSPDCKTATLSFNSFVFNDTLAFMQGNCRITSFNNNSTMILKDTPFQMDNPFSSLLYLHQIQAMKKSPLGDCVHKICIGPPNIYKKPNW